MVTAEDVLPYDRPLLSKVMFLLIFYAFLVEIVPLNMIINYACELFENVNWLPFFNFVLALLIRRMGNRYLSSLKI